MPRAFRRILVLWFLAGLAQPAAAIERVAFTMDSIEGADWRAEGLSWELNLSGQASSQVRIQRVLLPDPYGEIEALQIDCPGLLFEAGRIECPHGKARARAPWLADQAFALRFEYRPSSQRLHLVVQDLPAFGGTFNLQADYEKAWRVEASARSVAASALDDWLPALATPLEGWQLEGPLDAELRATARRVDYTFKATGLNFSDASGRYAGEALHARLQGELQKSDNRWQGPVNLSLAGGQAYIEPVYLDFSARPAQAAARLVYAGTGRYSVEAVELSQPGVVRASGSAQWQDGKLQRIEAAAQELRLPAAYEMYAKPFLLGTALESLQTVGAGGVQLLWTPQGLQRLDVTLDSVVLEDDEGRFAWDAVSGEVHWRGEGQVPKSRLHWQGGAFYKVLFGQASASMDLQGRTARLLQPLSLPVLEGALQINRLDVQNWGTPKMALKFDGELAPLNLEALTTALGWPRFGGQLSGRLPELDFRDGVLTLGGALQARVFDGEVQIRNLRVEDPFGRLPQLFADAYLRNLNLEKVTQAFSFGRIEGRLEGDIENLQMINWQPVVFDARLTTPEDDDSRHRISQRAIENISAIGGAGASAALSRGFLQFFDDFAYERIGISCRLSGGVCRMGGLEPSSDGKGYVLVKGRLLPRIDVIGYAREVDWATLVEQLKSVTEGEGPVLR